MGAEATGENIKLEQKAKIAIVNDVGDILTLTRSQQEESRAGEKDWPGGSFDEEDDGISGVLHREVEVEELPGTRLLRVLPLFIKSEVLEDGFKVSYLLAGTARFPSEGITLSHEHESSEWVAQQDYPDLQIPKKYKKAVAEGGPVFEELVQSYQRQEQGLRQPEEAMVQP